MLGDDEPQNLFGISGTQSSFLLFIGFLLFHVEAGVFENKIKALSKYLVSDCDKFFS